MRTFDEVLRTVPHSVTFNIGGVPRVRVLSESDRISAAREIIQREEDAKKMKRRLTSADAETLLKTVRALLGVVDCGKRGAPDVIDAARATLASMGRSTS